METNTMSPFRLAGAQVCANQSLNIAVLPTSTGGHNCDPTTNRSLNGTRRYHGHVAFSKVEL